MLKNKSLILKLGNNGLKTDLRKLKEELNNFQKTDVMLTLFSLNPSRTTVMLLKLLDILSKT